MLQLLRTYYSDGGRGWASQLQRIDMQAELPRLKAVVYDISRLDGGNPLLRRFSHQQVDWAITQLRGHETLRAGKRIPGWLEYCLKVMLGLEHPKTEANACMPEVRKQDKIKALLALGELLSQVAEHIDKSREPIRRDARLDELLQQLARLTDPDG